MAVCTHFLTEEIFLYQRKKKNPRFGVLLFSTGSDNVFILIVPRLVQYTLEEEGGLEAYS